MSKGRAVFTLVFLVIFVIGAVWTINNAWSNIIEAEKWVAYEYGACRYADGYSESECLSMGGEVSWPAINGKQAYDKYYSEPGSWVYGENPRLGLGIAAGNFILPAVYASPDPGRETDNVPPGPIIVPPISVDESQTQICPDGTEISIVMECPNPPGRQCPPNQLVIITQAGDCIAVPEPFTCPDGALAPTAEQCNDPNAPIIFPPTQLRQEQQLVDTPCGPIDPSKSMCNYLPQDPNELTAAEEAERAEQEQGQNEGEENEQGSEEQQQEDESSNGNNDNDGGEGNGAGGDDDVGEID